MNGMIVRTGDALYFITDGARYRVHDACWGKPRATPGHYKVVSLESPQSNTRYFATAGGV
jgi:hypothetical protein